MAHYTVPGQMYTGDVGGNLVRTSSGGWDSETSLRSRDRWRGGAKRPAREMRKNGENAR